MNQTTINPRRMPYVIVWRARGQCQPRGSGSRRDRPGDSLITSGFLAHEPALRRLAQLLAAPENEVLDTKGLTWRSSTRLARYIDTAITGARHG